MQKTLLLFNGYSIHKRILSLFCILNLPIASFDKTSCAV